MLSLQLLNVLLNIVLWAINGIVCRLDEVIYVSIAKLQLKHTGTTKATDSTEIDVFQWLQARARRLLGTNVNRTRSASWVFLLIFFSVCFLPAELVVETGIDVRQNCTPADQMQDGVCASPWDGHSEVGIACSALLVQMFEWVDETWDIVYQGSRPQMTRGEVHVQSIAEKSVRKGNRSIFASECQVTLSKCSDCGTLTVSKDGGAFNNIISNSSLAERELESLTEDEINKICQNIPATTLEYKPYHGDITFDSDTGVAFFFWALPCKVITSGDGHNIYEIRTKGVETLLSDTEVRKLDNENDWNINLSPNRTRLYDITCKSPGLGWKDMMKAVAIYRAVQLQQPGCPKDQINEDIDRLTPLSKSDALRALFALKVEDRKANTCRSSVPVYRECGTFDWSKAWLLAVLFGFALLGSIILYTYTFVKANISFPHNAMSWRRFAVLGKDVGSVNVIFNSEKGLDEIMISCTDFD